LACHRAGKYSDEDDGGVGGNSEGLDRNTGEREQGRLGGSRCLAKFNDVYDTCLNDLETRLETLDRQVAQCIRTLMARLDKMEEQYLRDIKGLAHEVRFHLFPD